ncbi:ABC transporter permease [Mycolicibacterium sp. OfavD-34-C]|uniref:ABC transporter permease n=1 Tax=Mycolicibacterium sp. OfavD-34-C TaxID=2917746 RepID=UPI001EF61FD9|nr:ABC transporter permease [Mycolicibacterium sp. OfavD-34-C]MCG7579477.1 ABC transporter permease [Mycolicibacterium sp. OfavD-34-C]
MTWPAVRLLSIRVLGAVAVLLALSVLIFALLYLAPGDVVKNLLGNRPSSPEAVNAIRAQYHLDESAVQQYLRWLSGFLHGDLGESVRLQVPVSEAISQRVGLTALLCAMAFVLSVLVAVPLGVLSAVRAGGWIDRSASGLAVIGLSAPTFAIGLLLLLVFAYVIPVLPVYGVGDGGLDTIRHLTLPAISLALGLGAIVVKLTRAAMLRELDTDYVTAARARGLSEATVLRIALRNAAIPITTGAGLLLTFLVGGTVLAEATFALPGLGTLLRDSVLFKDIAVVQSLTLLVACVIMAISLLADSAYLFLDPRVREHGRRDS